MPDQWDFDCPQTPDLAQTAEQVRLVCVCCGDLYGALQAPADAVYTWLDQVRCKTFKKLDRAGDKAVIGILETSYAIRDKLGASGPPYPGLGGASGPAPGSAPSADVSAAEVADCGSSGNDDVYTPAPGSNGYGAGDSDTVSGAALSQKGIQLDPVDLDRPLAFLFGERGARWHPAAIAWAGEWLAHVTSSTSLKQLIDERSEGKAQAMPATILDIP